LGAASLSMFFFSSFFLMSYWLILRNYTDLTTVGEDHGPRRKTKNGLGRFATTGEHQRPRGRTHDHWGALPMDVEDYQPRPRTHDG